jgi:hypothetical protein
MFKKFSQNHTRTLLSRPVYESLDSASSDEDLDDKTSYDGNSLLYDQNTRKYRRLPFLIRWFVLIGLICLGAGLVLGYLVSSTVTRNSSPDKPKDTAGDCAVTPSRREWNALSFYEKSDFIRAVRCMAYPPSQARPDGALFDDFPYVRAEFGWRSKTCSFKCNGFSHF